MHIHTHTHTCTCILSKKVRVASQRKNEMVSEEQVKRQQMSKRMTRMSTRTCTHARHRWRLRESERDSDTEIEAATTWDFLKHNLKARWSGRARAYMYVCERVCAWVHACLFVCVCACECVRERACACARASERESTRQEVRPSCLICTRSFTQHHARSHTHTIRSWKRSRV